MRGNEITGDHTQIQKLVAHIIDGFQGGSTRKLLCISWAPSLLNVYVSTQTYSRSQTHYLSLVRSTFKLSVNANSATNMLQPRISCDLDLLY